MSVFFSLICIFLIFITLPSVTFLIKLEARVNECHVKMLENARKMLEINDEVRRTIKKVNKVLRILSNKKLHQVKNSIMLLFDIIQIIMLIKSFNLSKNSKSINFKLLRYIAYAIIGQEIFRKTLNSVQNFCTI